MNTADLRRLVARWYQTYKKDIPTDAATDLLQILADKNTLETKK